MPLRGSSSLLLFAVSMLVWSVEIASSFLWQVKIVPTIVFPRSSSQNVRHDGAADDASYRLSLSTALFSSVTTTTREEQTTLLENRIVLRAQDFPYRVLIPSRDEEKCWIQQAMHYLGENGVCVLYSSNDNSVDNEGSSSAVISPKTCMDANDAALSRISRLQERIKQQQQVHDDDANDTNQQQQQVFRFQEVVSRDVAGGRFDMPVPWKGNKQQQSSVNDDDNDNELVVRYTETESKSIHNFHTSVESAVQPIMDELWREKGGNNNNHPHQRQQIISDDEDDSHVAASGFLINQPGSTDQTWHRDGPNAGLVNVFVPLLDLTLDIGPTEVWTNTHHDDDCREQSQMIVPLLKKGQILMMDYRTFHRGLGNSCFKKEKSITRTVAYAVWHKGAASSLADKLSYGLLPRAYPSIQEVAMGTRRRENEDAPFRVLVSRRDSRWIDQAAALLQQTGVCVLDDSNSNNTPLLHDVNAAALDRLEDLLQRITNRGVDQEEPFQFLEVIKKEKGRYDMPISWKNEQDTGTPLSIPAAESVRVFHTWMEDLIQPVLDRMWQSETLPRSYVVVKSGFMVNHPGSPEYQWSRECADEGYIQAFAPLDDVSQEIGPIEVWPKSHLAGDHHDSKPILPLLKKGQILLVDRRILYQYSANTMREWAMVYGLFQRGNANTGHGQEMSSDALTLEYD